MTLDAASAGMECKTVVELHEVNDRIVTGFPSVFGNVDDGGDLIEPGAYQKTLAERGARLRWLWQHDRSQPPTAKVLELAEVSREELPADVIAHYPEATGGLRVRREYLDTPRGNEVLAAIKSGALNEMSIGYDATKAEYPADSNVNGRKVRRVLKEIRLWEMSDVNWGMNAATANVKALLDLPSGPGPERTKALAEWLEANLHLRFTEMADGLFADGRVTREERIALSGLIGDALNAFNSGMQANELIGVRQRDVYAQATEIAERRRRLALLAKQLDF